MVAFCSWAGGKESTLGEGSRPIGENGEYHTATLVGPIFEGKIEVKVSRQREFGNKRIIGLEDFELTR